MNEKSSISQRVTLPRGGLIWGGMFIVFGLIPVTPPSITPGIRCSRRIKFPKGKAQLIISRLGVMIAHG